MKRINTWILLLLTGILITACSGKDDPKNASGPPKKRILPVYAFVVQPDTLNIDITASGTVLANEEVELHPEASGKVIGIFFQEGEYVDKGKVLIRINDKDLQAQLQKATYQMELARSDESRKKQLLEARGISQEEYEISLNKLHTSQAEIELIRAQLEKTSVTAPFQGRIGLRNISEGAYISPTTAITTLQQTNPVKIEFSIPQKYISMVRPGTMVQMITDKGEEMRATVYATDARIDESMRTIKIRARYPNQGNVLVPGMFVRIKVLNTETVNALIVPGEAIIPVQNGEKVYVVNNGVALPRKVITGYRSEIRVEIREGLMPGDTVITTGILMLRDSAAVRVEKLMNR